MDHTELADPRHHRVPTLACLKADHLVHTSMGTNAACDSETDWYLALGNVSAQCNGASGYFYDAQRQMAWGFTTYWDNKYCESVGWVGIG